MPALALKVGLLPLGPEDVSPSTDGSNPFSLGAPRTPSGTDWSTSVPLIVYSGDSSYMLTESVQIPAFSNRIRYSFDGSNWMSPGSPITIPSPILPSGTQFFMQVGGITGDPDLYQFKVSVPVGSIWQSVGVGGVVVLDAAMSGNSYVDSLNSGVSEIDFAVAGNSVVASVAGGAVMLDAVISGSATTQDILSGAGLVSLDAACSGYAVVGSVASGQSLLDFLIAGDASVGTSSTAHSVNFPHGVSGLHGVDVVSDRAPGSDLELNSSYQSVAQFKVLTGTAATVDVMATNYNDPLVQATVTGTSGTVAVPAVSVPSGSSLYVRLVHPANVNQSSPDAGRSTAWIKVGSGPISVQASTATFSAGGTYSYYDAEYYVTGYYLTPPATISNVMW